MRFEVPQFIEIEDKIVGPLTWKQFIYLAGGAGIAIALYLMTPFLVFAIFGIPVGALAGFLAFHQINNRPFSVFLEAFAHYISGTRLYLWRKDEPQIIRTEMNGGHAFMSEPQVNHEAQRKIASLSRKLQANNMQKQ